MVMSLYFAGDVISMKDTLEPRDQTVGIEDGMIVGNDIMAERMLCNCRVDAFSPFLTGPRPPDGDKSQWPEGWDHVTAFPL